VDGENALPTTGAAGEDEPSCVTIGIRRWQHADARPISVAEAGRAILASIDRRVDCEREQKEDEKSDEHFSNGGVHGLE
jgi:hypothetical protein